MAYNSLLYCILYISVNLVVQKNPPIIIKKKKLNNLVDQWVAEQKDQELEM